MKGVSRSTIKTPAGKQALLDAAAVLMDERGVDNVTLQDIGQASGHRNRSAVQYHFGSRVAVIQAVISQTMDPVDAERNMLLDHLEATGTPLDHPRCARGRRPAAGPPAAHAEGRRYLRIGAQLINHPRFMTDAGAAVAVNTSIARCAAYILPSLDHLPAPVVAERTSQATSFIIRACGDQARLIDSDPPPRPVLSVEDLTDEPGRHDHGHHPGADQHRGLGRGRGMTAAGRNRPERCPGHVLSCITYLWWSCRLRRENGPTSRYMWWGFSRWPGNCSLTIRSRLGRTGW